MNDVSFTTPSSYETVSQYENRTNVILSPFGYA
jgi:hypothetical protein